MTRAYSAADFCHSIGVNIHIKRSASNGAEYVKELAYLRVGFVRDTINGAMAKPYAARLGLFSRAGVTWDLIIPANPQLYIDFLSVNKNDIVSIEGPNEPNFEQPHYRGLTGAAAGAAIQHDLYTAVRQDPVFKTLPVINYAMGYHGAFIPTVNIAHDYDIQNLHAYAPQGLPPGAVVQALAGYMTQGGNAPLIVSETGYTTIRHNPAAPQTLEGVDEATQAKYLLDTLADDFSMGITKTYLYELQDDADDADNLNKEDHFGLFHHDQSPKPVALALHNLISQLSPPTSCAGSFTPQGLNIQATAAVLNPPLRMLLLQRCDHAYELLLWAEPVIWDHANHIPRAAAPRIVRVSLPQSQYAFTLFDPLSGKAAVSSADHAGGIDVAVPDHPVILQITQ